MLFGLNRQKAGKEGMISLESRLEILIPP